MIVIDFFRRIEAWLAGWPDTLLTLALLAVSSAGIAVALFAPRSAKALMLAWFIFP
jgi:CHASE2 domain-containing sensor protein